MREDIVRLFGRNAKAVPIESYKIYENGKLLAVVDVDCDLIRMDNCQWLPAEKFKEEIFLRRLASFVKEKFDTYVFTLDGCYAFHDNEATWLIEYANGKAKFTTDDEWEDVNDFFEHWERMMNDDI